MKPHGSAQLSKFYFSLVLVGTWVSPVCAQTLSQLHSPDAFSRASSAAVSSQPKQLSRQPRDLQPPTNFTATPVLRGAQWKGDAQIRTPVLSDLQPPIPATELICSPAKPDTGTWIDLKATSTTVATSNTSTRLLQTFHGVFGTPPSAPSRHSLPAPPSRRSPFSTVSLRTPERNQDPSPAADSNIGSPIALPASPFVIEPPPQPNAVEQVDNSSSPGMLHVASEIEVTALDNPNATNAPSKLIQAEDASPSDSIRPQLDPTLRDTTSGEQQLADTQGPVTGDTDDAVPTGSAFVSTAPVIELAPQQQLTPPTVAIVPDLPNGPQIANPIESISEIADGSSNQNVTPSLEHSPANSSELFRPYWSDEELAPFGQSHLARQYQLDEIVLLSLQNSPQVRSVLIDPQIAQMRVRESAGVFDPKAFVDSFFHDTSDPVGNTLTTGGPPRLNEHRFEGKGGFRKRNTRGGQFETAQQYKTLDNNSLFLVPRQQSDSKLVMSYTQPLWRGAGRAYNESSIIIARLEQGATAQDVTRKLQSHVFSVTKVYWELFYARALLLQSDRGVRRLENFHQLLVGRADMDSLRSQILNVEGAIARQMAQIANARSAIQTAHAQLRSLVNSPEMCSGTVLEMIPATPTVDMFLPIDIKVEIDSALTYHPEIQAVRERVCAIQTKLRVADNDLRPTLNLVMDGYVRGLAGDYNFGSSWADQYSQGAPSYSMGLQYERPYRNVAQKAILRIQQLELQQILLQLNQTLLNVQTDVDSATAQVYRTFANLEAEVQATLSSEKDVEYLSDRLRNSSVDNTQPIVRIDELLNAQVRLIQAENNWARAQVDHMVALANLRLATGTLFTVASPDILPAPPEVTSQPVQE